MAEISIEYVGSLFGHNGWVTSLAVGEDSNQKPLLVSGSRDRSLLVWNLDLENPVSLSEKEDENSEKLVGKPFKSLRGHNHFVSSIAISRDSKHVVSGSWDRTLRLWDLNTMKTRNLFAGHTKDVLTVCFSQDNRMIFSGGMDRTLRYWNIKGEEKHCNSKFDGWVSCMSHIRQGKDALLAVGSWDNKVRIIDSDYNFNRGIEGLNYGVVSMASDEDGEYLFVAEKNGTVKIWSVGGEKEEDVLKQTFDVKADLNAISFDSKYFTLLTCATSNGLSVREVKGNKETYSRTFGTNCGCLSLAWDSTKTYLFAGFTDGAIRVFKFGITN